METQSSWLALLLASSLLFKLENRIQINDFLPFYWFANAIKRNCAGRGKEEEEEEEGVGILVLLKNHLILKQIKKVQFSILFSLFLQGKTLSQVWFVLIWFAAIRVGKVIGLTTPPPPTPPPLYSLENFYRPKFFTFRPQEYATHFQVRKLSTIRDGSVQLLHTKYNHPHRSSHPFFFQDQDFLLLR